MNPVRMLAASAAVALSGSYAAAEAAASMTQSVWHMDERSGTVMADSTGTANGTLYHVALANPGFLGTAFGFNGTSSYVSVPSRPALNPGSAAISFTVHVKTGSLPLQGDFDLLRKGAYPNQFYKLEILKSGVAFCQFRGSTAGGTTRSVSGGPDLADQRWHTVTCGKTATAITLHIDGVAHVKQASIGSVAGTEPIVIGAHPGGDFYKGLLDEVSVTIG